MWYEDTLASGPKGQSKTKRAVTKLIPGPIQYYKIKSAMAMLYNKDTPGKKAKSPWYENFWSDYSASPQGFRLGD
jgi:hypothetical protein